MLILAPEKQQKISTKYQIKYKSEITMTETDCCASTIPPWY
ncbi:hypothetical protein D1AOALGA4SA_7617 [Olavius algarvensis Delta 1 endosymbiont]|nr:hypothetical protein D1AOALGA4SA_7617 [Olavius algarvensis Delta 1 endosymbiont]